MSLWDVRFQLCVNTWQHPLRCEPFGVGRSYHQTIITTLTRTRIGYRCPIDSMAPAAAPASRLGLAHPHVMPPPSCPLVYVAGGPNEIALWDLINYKCHLVRESPCLPALFTTIVAAFLALFICGFCDSLSTGAAHPVPGGVGNGRQRDASLPGAGPLA